MARLIIKDEQGNWALKGVKWNQLHVGETITQKVQEKIYGALAKLKDYEDCISDTEDSLTAKGARWAYKGAIEIVKGGGVDAN